MRVGTISHPLCGGLSERIYREKLEEAQEGGRGGTRLRCCSVIEGRPKVSKELRAGHAAGLLVRQRRSMAQSLPTGLLLRQGVERVGAQSKSPLWNLHFILLLYLLPGS